jgi:hypothetical protein
MNQIALALVAPCVQRLLKRVEHEVGLHRGAHAPADDAPGKDVDDEGHVHKALPGRDVGEVAHPQLVRPLGAELSIDPVQRARSLGIGHRRSHALASHHPAQPQPAHQALHRAARHLDALAIELLPDLVCAVDAHVGVPHALDLGQQLRLALAPGRAARRIT